MESTRTVTTEITSQRAPARSLRGRLLDFLVFGTGAARAPAPVPVQRVQLELLLQKTGALRILSPLPFATPLAFLFYGRWKSLAAIVWIALFFMASIGCYLRRKSLEARRPVPDDQIRATLRGRAADLALLGAMWGLAPWMLDSHGDDAYLVLTSIFIIGAVSLGSAIVSTHRQTIAAFGMPASLGMISACAAHGEPVGWVLAACMALFLSMILKWTYQQADLLEDSLTVRFEKEHLAQRLESANREKTRFFAAASHDLRQPLHAISLFTATLERAALDQPHAQTVSHLARSVQTLSRSMETMLDVSRLDAGDVQPRIKAIDVHELFVSLHNTFAGRAMEKGLQLRLRSPGKLTVVSDEVLLKRLLGNLIDNAIKYTQAGGVLVAARTIDPDGRQCQVRFDVVDTGIGIPREAHCLVFEEFYQLGNPQRDRQLGLGIGLSVVKRLSALLAHPIALKSAPGRGTRFHVRVPRGRLEAARADADSGAAQRVRVEGRLPRSVLVIDDEADSRLAVATLLASCGCVVGTAADIDQAEAVLRQQSAEAVIADFRLPGQRTGLEFLAALRERAPDVRVLLITGDTSPGRISAIKASGVPYLFKPARAQHLLDALRT